MNAARPNITVPWAIPLGYPGIQLRESTEGPTTTSLHLASQTHDRPPTADTLTARGYRKSGGPGWAEPHPDAEARPVAWATRHAPTNRRKGSRYIVAAAPTLITATPPADLAERSRSFSRS